MSDKVDDAIAAAARPAPPEFTPPDLTANVVVTAVLARDLTKGFQLSLPPDFDAPDLHGILAVLLEALERAQKQRESPAEQAGLVVPDRKIVRLT